ncbi:unnamed protein product [Allacma fusca]|uniref:Lipase domain-containing protein n=1 Tax=Allacma fusca TaxID=39272 RepID=A0A8J2JL02_9HEXA|nr:unnamed protein product [Allacma fusca]
MRPLIILICTYLIAGIAEGRVVKRSGVGIQDTEICYEKYGCFSNGRPWTSVARPLSALPKPPHEVGTRFLLFTRNDTADEKTGYELLPDKDAILRFSKFDSNRKTVFLIHGFTDSHTSPWMQKAKDGLLEKEDVNLIAVDWAPGAKSPYLSATANARLVGSQLNYMIRYLEAKTTLNARDVQIVAHSMGAHVAGYAGDRLDGRLGVITALDPMEPYFGDTEPIVRLDSSDAQFVEVIHTNGETGLKFGLGMQKSMGHVDIYPNGGKSQPGCKDTLGNIVSSIVKFITLDFDGALSTWACSHARVVDFYVESISSSCPFVSHSCSSYSDYNKGKCFSECSGGSCYLLGYGSDKTRGTAVSGEFYLNTDKDGTFCLNIAQPQSEVSASQDKTQGTVTVQIRSRRDGKVSDKFTVADGKIVGGDNLTSWIEVPSSLRMTEERPQVILQYKRGGLIPSLQPRYLVLNHFAIRVMDKDLQMQTIDYGAVTLETGVDIILS